MGESLHWVAEQNNQFELQPNLGSKAVKLTWSYGPSPAPSYQIQRLGQYDQFAVTLGTIVPSTATYVDTTVLADKKYTYRLIEVTDSGGLGIPSNESSICLRGVTFGIYCPEYKIPAANRNHPLGAVYFANLEASANPLDYITYSTVPNGDEFPVGMHQTEGKTVITQGNTYAVDWNASTWRFEASGPPFSTDEWAFTNIYGQITQDNLNGGYGAPSGPANATGYADLNTFVMNSFEEFAGTYAIPEVQMQVFTGAGKSALGVPAVKDFGATFFAPNDDYDEEFTTPDNENEIVSPLMDDDLVRVVIKLNGLSGENSYAAGYLSIPNHLRAFKGNGTLLVADSNNSNWSYVWYEPGAANGKLAELDSGEITLYLETLPGWTMVTDPRLMIDFPYLGVQDSVSLVPIEISFTAVGSNLPIGDNKNSQTGEWMPGRGKRIFPEWIFPADASPSFRNNVLVNVRCPITQFAINLKVFDVDDPEFAASVDENDSAGSGAVIGTLFKGDDNDEWETIIFRAKPKFISTNTQTATVTTNAQGITSTQLRVTRQPGDNLRVVAGKSQMLNFLNVDSVNSAGYVGCDQQPKIPGVVASPLLTTWRTLHVEVDSMAARPATKPAPDWTSASATVRQVLTPTDTRLVLAANLPTPTNFYEHGYVRLGSLAYNITWNEPSYLNIHHSQSAHPSGLDSFVLNPFELFDDDDRDTHTLLTIGTTVATLPFNPMNTFLRTPFQDAYIEIEQIGSSNAVIPWELNATIPATSAQDLSGLDKEEYWYHYLAVMYQPEIILDRDPDTEDFFLGHTFGEGLIAGAARSYVYAEVNREIAKLQTTGTNSLMTTFPQVMGLSGARELGHASRPGGSGDAEGELMDPDLTSSGVKFSKPTINRLRTKPRFQKN